MNLFLYLLGWGFAAAFILMTLLWAMQQKTCNAGIVDIGWSAAIPLMAVVYAVWMDAYGYPRVQAALCMVLLWGGRLAWHIHRRAHGKPEDARYADLRQAWGRHASWKFFLFFQFQAVAAAVFSIPMLVAVLHADTPLNALDWAGVGLWLIAWTGESSADWQLVCFKRNPANKGRVCDAGWWRYSRHPNYFFEWLIWVAWALFSWRSAPLGYLALVCPALMLYFLFKVTGIPATEEQALRSKGEAYRRYQQTTSAFVPWFRKKG